MSIYQADNTSGMWTITTRETSARMASSSAKTKKAMQESQVRISKTNNHIVVDKNIANNTADSSIRVVFPSIVEVQISDISQQLIDDKLLVVESPDVSYQGQLNVSVWDNNWILVKGHYYLVKAFIYDRDKNFITMTDNIMISNSIDPEYFEVVQSNKINSEVIVRAKKETPRNHKISFTSVLQSIKSQHPRFTY
jgi:hypothetical protein